MSINDSVTAMIEQVRKNLVKAIYNLDFELDDVHAVLPQTPRFKGHQLWCAFDADTAEGGVAYTIMYRSPRGELDEIDVMTDDRYCNRGMVEVVLKYFGQVF